MDMFDTPHPLRDYLATPLTCSCGHTHYASLRQVRIGQDALEDLPQRLEALFPGAERAENTAGGGVFPAEPMGATEEVAIFAFLYEGRNVWVALRDDQVLGVLEQSLENNTITCYDSAFQQTSQVELPFSLYNLQPQASVSPFPL